MSSNLNSFVTNIRKSVINQLNTANSIFDVVVDLSAELEKLPDGTDHEVRAKLTQDIVRLYNIAKSLSDNASSVGDDLARLVE